MKRERQVFDTRGVCKIWASASQSTARTPTGNLSIRVEESLSVSDITTLRYLYSYRTPVGVIVYEDGKEPVAIITSYKYSVTTSRHMFYARRFLNNEGIKTVSLPSTIPGYFTSLELKIRWSDSMKTLLELHTKYLRARTRKNKYLYEGAMLANDVDFMVKRFDLELPVIEDFRDVKRIWEMHKVTMRMQGLI